MPDAVPAETRAPVREQARPQVDLSAERPRHHPALDGVRALAVLAVVVYHLNRDSTALGPLGLPGGFLGVDVFFVLSGYLITSLLQGEAAANGRLDLKAFYARRSLRLLPALLLAVPLATVAALITSPRPSGILAGAGYALSYTTDLAALAGHPTGYLTHAWSLAIEEQFYLLWPPALLLLTRLRRPMPYVAGGIVLSAVATEYGYRHFGHANAMAPWTHTGALLLGAALALQLRARPSALLPLARYGWLGGVALLLSLAHPPDDVTLSAGEWLLVAAMAVTLLAHLELEPTSRLTRALGAPALVWLGRRSYGLYLFSCPVTLAVLSRRWPLPVAAAVTLPISLIVAAASYRYVEAPALRWKRRFSRGGRLATS